MNSTAIPRPEVTTYQLTAGLTGRLIRKATQVTFSDGKVIRFIDRLPKGEAIRQAEVERERQEVAAAKRLVEEGVAAGTTPDQAGIVAATKFPGVDVAALRDWVCENFYGALDRAER